MVSLHFLFFVFILNNIGGARPAKILMVFDKPGTSHYNDAVDIALQLYDRGHNITFLVPRVHQDDITVKEHLDTFSFIFTHFQKEDVDFFQASDKTITKWESLEMFMMPYRVILFVAEMYSNLTVDLLSDTRMSDEIATTQFDFVLFEGSFVWYHSLMRTLKIPYGVLTTSADISTSNIWFNAPSDCVTLPDILLEVVTVDLTSFAWRTRNCVGAAVGYMFYHVLVESHVASGTAEYSEEVRVGPITSFGQADVWLANVDFSTDITRPYLPATCLVGGLSIEDTNTLDQEYQRIINESGEHGILVVTMGTVVQAVSQEKTDKMAAAFARLPQTVVWKETSPRPTITANNIIIKPWIPQKALFANPKTRAVLFHGGNNGAFEALYGGLPIIAVPIYADQFDVSYRISSSGMGLTLDHNQMTDESLYQAITEVIHNPRYRERAQHLSAVYRHNPSPAKERAAFWIEYVLRHGGNKLRKARISQMGFIEKNMIDVYLTLAFLLVVFLYFMKKIIVGLLRTLFKVVTETKM